jgi:hypothetical protein
MRNRRDVNNAALISGHQKTPIKTISTMRLRKNTTVLILSVASTLPSFESTSSIFTLPGFTYCSVSR